MSANATASRHPSADSDLVRIGELARRVEVSPHVLRAWERRYSLLTPVRSDGGFRLYSSDDETRVREMVAQIERGIAPAQAAAALRAGAQTGDAIHDPVTGLIEAMERFDESAVGAVIAGVVRSVGVDGLITTVIVPFLREVGERWECGEATVAQEHFVSGVVRDRLMELATRDSEDGGPHAVLACPPDEFHDLPLVMTAIALRNRGWRVTMLGANTPVDAIAETATRLAPDVVLVASPFSTTLEAASTGLARIAKDHRVVTAGAGSSVKVAKRIGATHMPSDPIRTAHQISVMVLR